MDSLNEHLARTRSCGHIKEVFLQNVARITAEIDRLDANLAEVDQSLESSSEVKNFIVSGSKPR